MKAPYEQKSETSSPSGQAESPVPVSTDRLPVVSRAVTAVLLASVLLLVAAWKSKGVLVDVDGVLPELLEEPIQTDTDLEPFSFSYAGKSYTVDPVADYEIWGLVVSHNDIEGFMDLVHDESSVDTKDLCVIWGENLETNDFQRIEFTSGDFTCFLQFPSGVDFRFDSISNNHLITDEQAIRDVIAHVRVGDQIHILGSLVNYQEAGTRFWRRTSTTRRDTGNGACEVVFVEEIEILVQGTPVWYALYPLAWLLVILSVVTRVGLLVWKIVREVPSS